MSLIKGTLKNYPNNIVIETGTYKGDGVQAALDAGFAKVYSIEVSPELHAESKARFKGQDQVVLYCADSTDILWRMIGMFDERMTFVLDAHFLSWSKDTAGRKEQLAELPLIQELEIIAEHHIKTHTIIIDDVRLFGAFGTDIEAVKKLLLEINPDYTISLIDGVIEDGVVKAEQVMVAEIR